jgi:transposase
MQSISAIGLDIAKSVFQVHGVDAAGQVVVRRQLRRRHVLTFFQKLPPCLVGIEACAPKRVPQPSIFDRLYFAEKRFVQSRPR